MPPIQRPHPNLTATPGRSLFASLALHGGAIAAVLAGGVPQAAHWQASDGGGGATFTMLVRPEIEVPTEPPPMPLPPTAEIEVETVEHPPVLADAPPEPDRALPTDESPVPELQPLPGPRAIPNGRLVPLRRTTESQPAPIAAEAGTPGPAGAVPASPLPSRNQPPQYPARARRLGQEGTVIVLLEVDAHGDVTGAHVVESSGWSALDDAALLGLRQWQFAPATVAGIATKGTWRQTVRFRLVDGVGAG